MAAYDTLGVAPDADDEDVRRAYRERVKEVHPDAPNGSKERFKAVQDAYEQVTD
ncbi:MAG: J domain-containing protein [Clostridia bacterium]